MGTTTTDTIATAIEQRKQQPSNERAGPCTTAPEFDRVLTIFDRFLTEVWPLR